MRWTGEEKFDCYCGTRSAVLVQEGRVELFCFGHTYESGMVTPLPSEKPEDWDPGLTYEDVRPLLDAGESNSHPTLAGYLAKRREIYELTKLGFVEAHPEIPRYMTLNTKLKEMNEAGLGDSKELCEEMDVLWEDMDYAVQSYIRNILKAAPPGKEEEDECETD